jgi:hypothetical protein
MVTSSNTADNILFSPIQDCRDNLVLVGNTYYLWWDNFLHPKNFCVTRTMAEGLDVKTFEPDEQAIDVYLTWREFLKMRVKNTGDYC